MNDFLTRIEKLSPKRLALLAYELQTRLDRAEKAAAEQARATDRATEPIAVIGLGCRFPGAPDVDAYWNLLRGATDAVGEIPADRWDIEGTYDPDPDAPGKMSTRWGGFLGPVDQFDAPFFGISRREAVSMDPQQRLLLEVAWEALEHAGQSPRALSGTPTGVFVGLSTGDYYGLLRARGLEEVDAYMATGTAHSVAAGRVAYVLGLQGPNVAVDTACSSSLVAVHLACQSLRGGESRIALAGGVNLILAPDVTIALSKSHMMAPDGHCKPFDARADGFVRGEGCGVVVLKRLSDARADGDRVLAVIRGSATNQDGRSSGITAPNGASQQIVIRRALEAAGVKPDEVGYVEAHGTGTSLGDPIEAHALAAVFGPGRASNDPLVVGSVKANIGHLEAAAGVAGIIKVVLALQHGRIPPQLHFHEMNPHIDWGALPVDIPVGGRDWTGKRVAGVSSFGFGGSNVHVVLGEAESTTAESTTAESNERPGHLLALSARGDGALRELMTRYAARIEAGDDLLGDFCYSANIGRSHLSDRAAFVARTREEMVAALRAEPTIRGNAESRPKVAFLFTGQGSQWAGMGRELYDTQPVFRAALDQCAAILDGVIEVPLLDLLYGEASARLDETGFAQPALFAVEYALAELWRSWGVRPAAVLGHSVGEYVALCVAGVWSLDDALKLIAERGRMMQALGGGWGMTSVSAARDAVAPALVGYERFVSVAAVNGPESTVLSGRLEELGAVEAKLAAQGVETRRLTVSHAFHSPQMDAVADAFAERAAALEFRTPTTAVLSSVTGERVTVETLRQADYWRRQVRDAVQFHGAMTTLAASGYDTFVEVGPAATLTGLGRQCLPADGLTWASSVRRERPEKALGATRQMLSSLGTLYARGVEVDFVAFDAPFARRRVSLPTYPFQRQRYWLDQTATRPAASGALAGLTRLTRANGHAMLRGRVPAAVPIFEAELNTDTFPFIADHRVGGTAVLPGSVYTELALAAADEAFGDAAGQSDASLALQHPPRHAVQGLVLREPLRLDAAGRRVQVVFTPTGAEQASVQILSQPAGDAAASWTTHALATVSRAPSAPAAPDLAALRQGVTGTFATDEFYDALRTHGIELGARCRGIHALWADDRQVLAEVRLDPSLAEQQGGYRMHPALLDSCLQVFGALLLRTGGGGDEARVLTRVGQFTLFAAPAATVWCHATLDPDTGAGRVVVLDESGKLVAEASGLETSAVGGDTSDAPRPQPVDDWFYEVAWTPTDAAPAGTGFIAGDVLADGALATRLQAEADRRFDEQKLERYNEAHADVSALAATYIGDALRLIAADLAPGSRFTTESLAASAGVVDAHQALFGRLLEILGEDGYLRRTGGSPVSSDSGSDDWELVSLPEGDADAMVNALLVRFPAFAADLTLTARCATQLGPVLQGTADPLQLLFPGGNTQELEGLYTDSPSAQAFNPLVKQAVLDAIAAAPAGRTVRILEIGAGTGGTTGFVVPALPADRVEYTFTDVSPLFLARASERFEAYPFMRYETLDIEAPATPPERYDIVLAANVLHATADMRVTMGHVRERLAPGGLLVLLEGTTAERWVDLTFGMTDGWWRFTDRDLRPRYALLDTPTWRTLLSEAGFGQIEAVAPRQGTQQVVLLAQAPQSAAGRWLVVGDGGLAAAVEAELRTHDVEATRVAASELPSAVAGAAGVAGVVYLGGLAVPSGTDASAIAGGTAAAVEALEVMRLAATTNGAKLWMVTRGAQPAGDTPASPLQAPLWGLGRTFALEHPDAWGGLVDVDPAASDDANAAALWAAVGGTDDEDQRAIRGDATLAPRMERRAAPTAAAPTFSATGKYLVTGGLGNIGLRIAEWLVANGARHVVLNGRTGLPDRAAWDTLAADAPGYRRVQAVRALEAQGATVTVLTADLSRPEAADTLRAAFAPGELRGVLHAAAVFDANPIERATPDELRRVLDTKTVGATVVSDLARAAKADFVVLFSSTTALLGVRGMAAYAAANQALDSLAHTLRQDGVPALSVDWGTWDELGDLSEEVRQSYVRAGLLPMPSGQALDALGRAIAAGETQLTIAQIDWSALKSIYQARRRRPILAHVANREAPAATPRAESHSASAAAKPTAPADVLAGIAALPEAERSRRLLEIVRTTAASVLGLQADEVDPQLGLFEMGMDSLMSVELRARLERAVGRKLPSTLTFNYPNVRALAGYLEGLVTPKPAAPAAAATPATPAPAPTAPAALADVDSDAMSEDEIAAMLSDALQSMD